MNGFGLTVMGPWPQFTVALALTSALTTATAGTARSKASWTEPANEGKGVAASPALAASTVAHRTLEALAFIGLGPVMLALHAGRKPEGGSLPFAARTLSRPTAPQVQPPALT